MSGPFNEELLSAWHDGELDDSQRQSMADRIAGDSELREVLDDFAELSSTLKSLPCDQAPAELHAAVMRQVRDGSAVHSGRNLSRPSRRHLWLWIAGSAASLLIVAGLMSIIPGLDGDNGQQVADMVSSDEERSMESAAMATAPENADAGFASRGSPPAQSRSGASMPQAALTAPAETAPAETAPPEEMPPGDEDSFANDPQLQSLLRSLDEVVMGQTLHVLRDVNGELTLYEFLVVDTDTTLGDDLVLLSPVRRQPLSGQAAQIARPRNRLCGVFLEGTREQLQAAIEESDLTQVVKLVDASPEAASPAEGAPTAMGEDQADLAVYKEAVESFSESGESGSQQEITRDSADSQRSDETDSGRARSRFLLLFLDQKDSGAN